jgi:ATP-dependent Lhr-like helicase
VEGRWSSLELEGEEGDPLDEEELDRERVRILLGRYGIILRPLLERELGLLSWKRLFPCMRRMELAGELHYGHFFQGLPAPQFMGPEGLGIFRSLGERVPEAEPLWLSALDPASPAAFPFDERPALNPPRAASVSLCLAQGRVVAFSRRSGKDLALAPGLDDADAAGVLRLWSRWVGRVVLETIDGVKAGNATTAPLLIAEGFERDRGNLRRW